MSITIVSLAAKIVAPPLDGGQASDPATSGADFASLLLGQLPTPNKDLSKEFANGQAPGFRPEEQSSLMAESTTGTAAEAAAALMSSLGLIKAEPTPTAPPPAGADDANGLAGILPQAQGSGPLDTLSAMTSGAGTDRSTTAQDATNALPNTAGGAEQPLAQNITPDKPAKFADLLAAAPDRTTIEANLGSEAPSAPQLPPAVHEKIHAPATRETAIAVPTPVRDANWSTDFNQKIVWLAGNGKQSAELTLNPPQMGPIEITLNIDKGSASATFVSANAEVRQSIETALPRLREMFASAGIELGQANVSAESFRQASSDAQHRGGDGQARGERAILVAESIPGVMTRALATGGGRGMVDIFA